MDVTFVFIQAETSSGFTASKIGTFGHGVSDFFRDQPRMQRNTHVAAAHEIMQAIYDRSSKFRKGNPLCKLFYVTTGKWTDEIPLRARIDAVCTDLRETDQFRSVDFTPMGAAEVQKRYRQTRHAKSSEFVFSNRITVPEVPKVPEAYVGFLPWSEFKKLIIEEETGTLAKRLFFDNVRDWQGYNNVNSDIRHTLDSPDKSQFVLMNNGVTIIARTVQATGNKFTIEDYQIVNGCQTSNVLYEQRDLIDDSVAIPVKLISTRDEGVTKAIIKATNWQTAIKEEQLFALEEFPKSLEAFFAAYPEAERLYFERRPRQYESEDGIEKTRIILFDVMIKSFAAMFLNEPHRTTRSFKSIKAKLGDEIFAKGQMMEPYYTAALAFYKLEYAFRNRRLGREYKPARFHILLAIRILAAGFDRPQLTANKIVSYCQQITNVLNDPMKSEECIKRAAKIVEVVAGDDFNRDNIRTEPFTERVISMAK